MFFQPDIAEKLVKYLRAGDKGHAFLAAYDLVECPDLAKTAVLPEGEVIPWIVSLRGYAHNDIEALASCFVNGFPIAHGQISVS